MKSFLNKTYHSIVLRRVNRETGEADFTILHRWTTEEDHPTTIKDTEDFIKRNNIKVYKSNE